MKKVQGFRSYALITLLIIIISTGFLYADSIVLKSGRTLQGKVISQDDKNLTFHEKDKDKSTIYKKSDIKTINIDRTDIKKNKTDESQEPGFMDKYKPAFLLLPGISMPTGDIADVLDMGYSLIFVTAFDLPMFNYDQLQIRVPLLTGYFTFSSKDPDITATVSIIPVTAGIEAFYLVTPKFHLFAALNAGVSFLSMDKKTEAEGSFSESSIDPTFVVFAGVGYALYYNIELFAAVSYLRAFEELSGDFININVGIGFTFYIPNIGEKNENKI
jgi:hypothetical protein